MTMREAELDIVRDMLARGRTSSGTWLRVSCPFCLDRTGRADYRDCFGINKTNGYCHCFRCGYKCFLPEFESTFERECVRDRMDRERSERDAEVDPPEDYTPLWELRDSILAQDAIRYVRVDRQLPWKIIREAGIGTCFSGPCVGRVVVPVWDCGMAWVGWSARKIGKYGWGPKYLTAKGMRRQYHLFNEAALFVRTTKPILVTEGVFDALPYWPHAVACLGKPTAQQEALLQQATRPVAVCLDGDAWEEGQLLSWRLRFDGHPRVGNVHLPPCTDPATVDPAWVWEQVETCWVDWF